MSRKQVYKLLAQLTYNDMQALAEEIHTRMRAAGQYSTVGPSAAELSALLATMGEELRGDDAVDPQERKLLAQVFNRKRTVSIQRSGGGYAVTLPTVPGSSVVGADLREALAYMLDQVIAHQALTGGNNK